MTKSIYNKIKRLLIKAEKEIEDEVLKEEGDITSPEFEEVLRLGKKAIIEAMGFTLAEYEQFEADERVKLKGERGEKGDTVKGEKGERGEKGETIIKTIIKKEAGERGLKGDKGEKGDMGEVDYSRLNFIQKELEDKITKKGTLTKEVLIQNIKTMRNKIKGEMVSMQEMASSNYVASLANLDYRMSQKIGEVTALITAENLWNRSDSTITPKTANDSVDLGSGNLTTTGNATINNLTMTGDNLNFTNSMWLDTSDTARGVDLGGTYGATALTISAGNVDYYATFDISNLTTNVRTFTFPNISGTLVTTNGALANIDIGAYTLQAGTLTIGSGSITDSSGAISFDNENLITTGTGTFIGGVYAKSDQKLEDPEFTGGIGTTWETTTNGAGFSISAGKASKQGAGETLTETNAFPVVAGVKYKIIVDFAATQDTKVSASIGGVEKNLFEDFEYDTQENDVVHTVYITTSDTTSFSLIAYGSGHTVEIESINIVAVGDAEFAATTVQSLNSVGTITTANLTATEAVTFSELTLTQLAQSLLQNNVLTITGGNTTTSGNAGGVVMTGGIASGSGTGGIMSFTAGDGNNAGGSATLASGGGKSGSGAPGGHLYLTTGAGDGAAIYGNVFIAKDGGFVRIGSTATPTVALHISGETIVNDKIKMTSIGGFAVKLTNKTGSNTIKGQLVQTNTALDDSFVLAAVDEKENIGIVLDAGVSDGSGAWIVVIGIADVAMKDNTAATRGNWIKSSDEAGYSDATNAAPPGGGIPELDEHMQEIGNCIESVSAGGAGTHILARCVLHFN